MPGWQRAFVCSEFEVTSLRLHLLLPPQQLLQLLQDGLQLTPLVLAGHWRTRQHVNGSRYCSLSAMLNHGAPKCDQKGYETKSKE